MTKRIIFHLPFKIDRDRAAASQLRPLKLIEAFMSLGFIVDLVEGYGKEREQQILVIKNNIKRGVRYLFLYSESSTMPTLLTERNHFPRYPFLDFSFFKFCKENNIKIGVFYRDIYWRFQMQKTFKSRIAYLFYLYDLKKYSELLDVLFVPSLEMISFVQKKINSLKIVELPPGCEIIQEAFASSNSVNMNILYIGGIGAHYDLTCILDIVSVMPEIHFTLCCRKDDLIKTEIREKYSVYNNIEIVHKKGSDIVDLYKSADLFCIFIKPIEYWNFAVPFKLFETIAQNCPIIATKETWVGRFVKKNNIGIVSSYDKKELKEKLIYLLNNRTDLDIFKTNLYKTAIENTWLNRCQEIEFNLIDNKIL